MKSLIRTLLIASILILVVSLSGCTQQVFTEKECSQYEYDVCPEQCTVCTNCVPCSGGGCHSKEFCEDIQRQWDELASSTYITELSNGTIIIRGQLSRFNCCSFLPWDNSSICSCWRTADFVKEDIQMEDHYIETKDGDVVVCGMPAIILSTSESKEIVDALIETDGVGIFYGEMINSTVCKWNTREDACYETECFKIDSVRV